MDPVGHGLKHMLQELKSCLPVSPVDELGHGELARPVDADEEIQLAFSGLNLGDVDMEEPCGLVLELRPLRLVPLHIRQARDAMSLQASVQH